MASQARCRGLREPAYGHARPCASRPRNRRRDDPDAGRHQACHRRLSARWTQSVPDDPHPHAALAAVYWDAYVNNWAFDLGMPSFRAESRANEHLAAALAAPTPLAHAVQSRIYAALGYLDEAVAEAKKVVALDGNDATVLAGLANVLVLAERPGEALAFIEQAMRLDSRYPPNDLITLGAAQFGLERFEEAAATFERAVARNPDDEMPLIYLASSYGHLGRIDDADDTIETANALRARSGLGGDLRA